MRRPAIIALTLLLYSTVIAATWWGLLTARRSAIASFDNSTEQVRWEEFRAEMDERHVQREALREKIARESGQPILPQPPKSRSERPPALELLTHHFAACAAVALLAVSGLFAVIWGLALGAMLRPGRSPEMFDELENPNIRPEKSGQLR